MITELAYSTAGFFGAFSSNKKTGLGVRVRVGVGVRVRVRVRVETNPQEKQQGYT